MTTILHSLQKTNCSRNYQHKDFSIKEKTLLQAIHHIFCNSNVYLFCFFFCCKMRLCVGVGACTYRPIFFVTFFFDKNCNQK